MYKKKSKVCPENPHPSIKPQHPKNNPIFRFILHFPVLVVYVFPSLYCTHPSRSIVLSTVLKPARSLFLLIESL
jgi:hypothetical protein